MNLSNKLLVLFSLIISAANIFSQDQIFISYTPNQGLSQGTVFKMLQDKQGFIWIGTDDGLNCFDGYSFKVMGYEPGKDNSLSDNNIYDLAECPEGKIWIATAYGLNCYNPVTDRFTVFLHSPDDPKSISSNIIKCILHDQGRMVLWIGFENGVINQLNYKTLNIKKIINPLVDSSNLIREHVKSLCVDKKGILWIGTNGAGFYRMDNDGNFKKYYRNLADENLKKPANTITVIFEDSKQRLWLGTDGNHIELFDRDKEEFYNFGYDLSADDLKRKGKIRSIIEDRRGKIWAATYGGLTSYDAQNNNFSLYFTADDKKEFSLTSNRLLCLLEDNAGSIWIGNYDKGINILHKPEADFRHFRKIEGNPGSLAGNIVLAFEEDKKGNLLVGTYDAGLSVFDRKTGSFFNQSLKNSKLNKGILCLYSDKNGLIWIGTWGGGLQKYNPADNSVVEFQKADEPGNICNNTIVCMYASDSNILWLGTYGGLSAFNTVTYRQEKVYTRREGLLSDVIFCITPGLKDTLWIGTKDGGMSLFIPSGNKFINYVFDKDDTLSLSNNVIKHIYDDRKGSLWIATERGLNRFDKKTKKFDRFFDKHGLPNNNIWAIIPDEKGNLWMSTNNGVSRFSPARSKTKNAFRNFTVDDGLQSNEFNQGAYFKSLATKEIYFGGINGFNAFLPADIEENTFIPPVHLTSFKIFDKEVRLDTSIIFKRKVELSYRENFISFEFTGLDYTAPENNLFQYMMVGLDQGWSPTSKRRYASYPGLAPGKYTFKVRATNSQGIWNETGCSLIIIVTPPFWKTVGFYIFCTIFIIVSVLLYIRFRTRRLLYEKKVLEETVAQRTRELRQKNLDITASIQYARRLQQALIAPMINQFLQDFQGSFVLFKPKDIVSGDYFWYAAKDHLRIFAVADCTGHGVPGAFMSIIGYNSLEKVINESHITNPAEALTKLNELIKAALHQKGERGEANDGMDMALCCYDTQSNLLQYAGAYRPLIHIRNKEISRYNADRFSIGGQQMQTIKSFNLNTIEIKPGDAIYLFSDGYQDQFGGPDGKKFMMSHFLELLQNISTLNSYEQDIVLEQTLDKWIEGREQIDDILVAGIKF